MLVLSGLSLTLPPLFHSSITPLRQMLDPLHSLPIGVSLPSDRTEMRTRISEREKEKEPVAFRVGKMEIRDLRGLCLFEDMVLYLLLG